MTTVDGFPICRLCINEHFLNNKVVGTDSHMILLFTNFIKAARELYYNFPGTYCYNTRCNDEGSNRIVTIVGNNLLSESLQLKSQDLRDSCNTLLDYINETVGLSLYEFWNGCLHCSIDISRNRETVIILDYEVLKMTERHYKDGIRLLNSRYDIKCNNIMGVGIIIER